MDQAIACCGNAAYAEIVRGLVGTVPSEVLEDMMSAVERNSSEEVLRAMDRLVIEGQSPTHFARQMVRFLRNAIVAKVAGTESSLLQISSDERARVGRVASLVRRGRADAISADSAAHIFRVGLQAGAAVPPRIGIAQDGPRSAFAAARAIAERSDRAAAARRIPSVRSGGIPAITGGRRNKRRRTPQGPLALRVGQHSKESAHRRQQFPSRRIRAGATDRGCPSAHSERERRRGDASR